MFQIEKTLMSTSTLIFLIKYLVWAIVMCVQCEGFYMAIEKMETICILRSTDVSCSGEFHLQKLLYTSITLLLLMLIFLFIDYYGNLYKNIIRLNRVSFSKISACGLFDVDAALLMKLLLLLTNHIIVVLQFFLSPHIL